VLNRAVDSARAQGSKPPHNPGLRDLIAAKRQFSSPLKREDTSKGFLGWHERGYLPHRDEPGLVQFVTFRLIDSLPESLRAEWEHLFRIEDDQQRRRQFEAYLDRGRGKCYLRQERIASLVQDALLFRHGSGYDLRAWVIMPNHVHVLFRVGAIPMAQIVEGWKRFTSKEANRILNRRGAFWQAGYWDTYMRDAEHESKVRRYIESNPTRAFRIRDPKDWAWSSARYRDPLGVLRL